MLKSVVEVDSIRQHHASCLSSCLIIQRFVRNPSIWVCFLCAWSGSSGGIWQDQKVYYSVYLIASAIQSINPTAPDFPNIPSNPPGYWSTLTKYKVLAHPPAAAIKPQRLAWDFSACASKSEAYDQATSSSYLQLFNPDNYAMDYEYQGPNYKTRIPPLQAMVSFDVLMHVAA